MGQRLMRLPEPRRAVTRLHAQHQHGIPQPEPPMPHIDLIYFNAGGGHRAAARGAARGDGGRRLALARAPGQPVRAARPAGPFRRITGMAPEDLYNRRLARGWTLRPGAGAEAAAGGHPPGASAAGAAAAAALAAIGAGPGGVAGAELQSGHWPRACRPRGPACPSSPCSPTWPTTRRISGSNAAPDSMWSAAPIGRCSRRARRAWTSATCTAAPA